MKKHHHTRNIFAIILLLFMTACSTSGKLTEGHQHPSVNTPPDTSRNLSASTCMTDKQYKMRLDFVKDSMRIEARTAKTEVRYEYRTKRDSIYLDRYIYKLDTKLLQDSIKAYRKMYQDSTQAYRKTFQDSMKALVPITKYQEKTNRTEIRKEQKTERSVHRQDEKTKRSKWWVWLIAGFTIGILVSNIKIRPFPF